MTDTVSAADAPRPDPVDRIAALLGDDGATLPDDPEAAPDEGSEAGAEREADPGDEIEAEGAPDEEAAPDDEQESDAELDAEGEPDKPAIDPPASMSAEERERFKALPPDAQEWLVAREKSLVSDYTRKTQEIADSRKRAQSELAALTQKRTAYDEGLHLIEQQLQASLGAVDPAKLAELRETHPAEWAAASEQNRQTRERLAAIQAERQRVAAEHHQQVERAFQQELQEAAKRLPEVIPEWRDPQVAAREKAELTRYLVTEMGFAPEDVARVTEVRLIAMARKARLYDQQQAARGEAARKKVASAPPTVKPGRAQPRGGNSDAAAAARQRLRKSGRIEDAAALIMQQL